MAKQASQNLIGEINTLEPSSFQTRIIEPSMQQAEPQSQDESYSYQISNARVETLAPKIFEACFRLIEETSAAAYKSSSRGWQPKDKKAEMMDNDMRFIVVSDKPSGEVVGFASYMFTIEDDYPVVYLYELHLQEQLRGKGIGAHLMRIVEQFGRHARVEKAMLTVFTSNEGAERFYRKHGYDVDEYSPQPRLLRGGRVKRPDYLILSKSLA